MDKNFFPGLERLKQRLDTSQQAEFYHEKGYKVVLGFNWKAGAGRNKLLIAEQSLKIKLPLIYRRFLEGTNGATLFYDVKYGQWGYKFFDTDELVEKQNYWSKIYDTDWRGRWLAFGECFGDADILLLDLQHPSPDDLDCAVIDGDSRKAPADWPLISHRFSKWIDYLVVAQGTKFWRWL